MDLSIDYIKLETENKSKFILEPSAEICIPCRGTRYLCGRSYCPIIVRTMKMLRRIELSKRIIEGSSPPAVFVGRFGYPKVSIGYLVPPIIGETSHYDLPESWSNLKLEDILNFRFSMVRGYRITNIEEARNEPSWLLNLQEIAASKHPVDMELRLKRIPSKSVFLDEISHPMGPSAILQDLRIFSEIKMDEKIEKVYYSKDLSAREAIIKLYMEGKEVSKIAKALSVGMLGFKKSRKLVPTRWSITAVDDTISKELVERIKYFETIDKIRVYFKEKHLNRFVIIMLPNKWSYEWIECWYPHTTWNLYGKEAEAESDYESFKGKKEYSSLGGCYYAVRLAVAERLNLERRQATVLAIREILPGFITSIGVWFVRESIREVLKEKFLVFEDIKEALEYSFSKLLINKNKIIEKSKILKNIYFQTRIKDFLIK